MSRKLAALVYERRAGSAVRKAVLAYLAELASDNGKGIWASKATIAAETECARSTVIKAINEFVAEGILITVGHRKCQNGATVEYDLDVAKIEAMPHVKKPGNQSATRTRPDADPSATRTPPVRHTDPKPSATRTQTVLEPSLNQEDPLYSPKPEKPDKARIPDGWVPSDDGWEYARSLQIPDEAISDEARGFQAYWADRTDRDSRKSERGWEQCWQGWCRRIASRYRSSRGMAGKANPGGYGQGGSLASIVARRRADGAV